MSNDATNINVPKIEDKTEESSTAPEQQCSSLVETTDEKPVESDNVEGRTEKDVAGEALSEEVDLLQGATTTQNSFSTDYTVITVEQEKVVLPKQDGVQSENNLPLDAETPGPSHINNNNCIGLLPMSSKTNQMIPIALLRKTSTCSVEECAGAGGLMQIIGATNKVAPAATNSNSSTTVGAAVLMLIPKKSDVVCVDIHSEQDQENNCPVENSELQQQHINSRSELGVVKPTQSYDSYEEVCRICHDNPSKLELMSPCLCKGSMSKVHRSCLERWLGESAKNSCEICGYVYNTVRKPKYTGCRSIFQWIRHPLSPSDTRNLFFDIACFFILTPLAAISSWLCVVGAQQYTFGEERRKRNKLHEAWNRNDLHTDASNATWTSVGLLSLTGTLLVAYSVWLFVAIKYHIQAWTDWQQRNFTVTIVPYEDGCMGRPPLPRDRTQSSSAIENNNNLPLQLGSGSSDGNRMNAYNFDANPSFASYTGHSGAIVSARERSLLMRRGHHRLNYNLPPMLSEAHFLRNPPPGYTISEAAMLYQALCGSDSESFLSDNIIAFLAESSENMTEQSSSLALSHAANTETNNTAEQQVQQPCQDGNANAEMPDPDHAQPATS